MRKLNESYNSKTIKDIHIQQGKEYFKKIKSVTSIKYNKSNNGW